MTDPPTDPPIPRPHDALFKAAFETPKHAGALLDVILPDDVCAAIDWSTMTPQSGSFIDPDLADRQSDLLFSVDLGGQRALLYLLLEHQSTVSPIMPLRIVDYQARIWKRYVKEHDLPLPLLISATVSHAPGGWTGPRTLHELIAPSPSTVPGLEGLVMNHSMLILDLAGLDDDQLRAWAFEAFPLLVLLVLRDGRDAERLRANIARWHDLFLDLLHAPNGADAVAQVLRYISQATGTLSFREFLETIKNQLPEVQDIAMTIAEELHQKGHREGLQKGRQEGRQEGRADMLMKMLTLKFGELSTKHIELLEASSLEQLDLYAERILSAESIEQLFGS